MNEERRKKITDMQVRAFMAFARSIRPGWRAKALALPLIALVKLLGIRKDVARRNIMLCFPEKSRAERERILAESYENMIWTGVELLAWQHDPTLIDRMAVSVEGTEHVENAFARGKGVVIFSAHLGNWELSPAWFSRRWPFCGVVRNSDSPFQRELIATLRATSGLKTIDKKAPMMRVISMLRKNGCFGALADQHGDDGFKAPFFGQETGTATGPAAFSVLTGAPMIPFALRRLEPFKFAIKMGPPLDPAPENLPRPRKPLARRSHPIPHRPHERSLRKNDPRQPRPMALAAPALPGDNYRLDEKRRADRAAMSIFRRYFFIAASATP